MQFTIGERSLYSVYISRMSISLFSSFSILQTWLPVRRRTWIAGSLTNEPRCYNEKEH